MATLYDPPGGWMYGFPKLYEPLENEELADTLLRDGYPAEEIESIRRENGVLRGVRFWPVPNDA